METYQRRIERALINLSVLPDEYLTYDSIKQYCKDKQVPLRVILQALNEQGLQITKPVNPDIERIAQLRNKGMLYKDIAKEIKKSLGYTIKYAHQTQGERK